MLVIRKSGQEYSAQQLTFNQSAEVAEALNKMVNASQMVIADTFGLGIGMLRSVLALNAAIAGPVGGTI